LLQWIKGLRAYVQSDFFAHDDVIPVTESVWRARWRRFDARDGAG
jgi:hypothetical protein